MITKTVAIYYGGFLDKAGGVISHVKALQLEMQRNGLKVKVFSLENLPVWCRYFPHLVEKIFNYFYSPIGFLYKGLVTRFLYRLLLSNKVDLHIFEDIYISWNSETPSVTVLHAVWSDNLQAFNVDQKSQIRLKSAEVNLINNISHPIVTVSFPYLEYLMNMHFNGAISKEISVIELGINQSAFHSLEESHNKSIVYCGSLEARKNVQFLLEVFKKVIEIDPEYKLTIIGDGPDKQKLNDFVKKNRLPVIFLGQLDHDHVLSELKRHEIYLHTSKKESFSYSLLEAKLSGLKTCAYSKLQVPAEFIDAAIGSFEMDDWCHGILNIYSAQKIFNADKYSVEKMTLATLRIAR